MLTRACAYRIRGLQHRLVNIVNKAPRMPVQTTTSC